MPGTKCLRMDFDYSDSFAWGAYKIKNPIYGGVQRRLVPQLGTVKKASSSWGVNYNFDGHSRFLPDIFFPAVLCSRAFLSIKPWRFCAAKIAEISVNNPVSAENRWRATDLGAGGTYQRRKPDQGNSRSDFINSRMVYFSRGRSLPPLFFSPDHLYPLTPSF